MATKLTLDYDLISGPWGNANIRTKIDGPEESLPFDYIYLEETPLEVLKFLVRDYNVNKFLDIRTNNVTNFDFKDHSLYYGLSIEEVSLKGATIDGKLDKDIDLSFLSKKDFGKNHYEGLVKSLISKYIIKTHTEYGPIVGGLRFKGDDGRGPRPSYEKEVIENYFEDRRKSKNLEKEKKLLQIIEYSQAVLNKPEFSIKDLEKLASI